MALVSKSHKVLRKVASKAKHKALFACKAISGQPVYRVTVPVENILIGTQCGKRLEHWVESTGDYSRVSRLLSQSPYVSFLNDIKADPASLDDDGFLKSRAYFATGMLAIQHTGSYFNAIDESGMLAQMRYFGALYNGFVDGVPHLLQEECEYRSDLNEMIWAYQIKDSSMVELDDGHHRASCMLVGGRSAIEVLIIGRKSTYLQGLIRECNGSQACRLVEPVHAPDVSGWSVETFAKNYWSIIQEFEERSSGLGPSKGILCITPGYGWICRKWLDRGNRVFGVFDSNRCALLGRICFGLGLDQRFTAIDRDAYRSMEGEFDTVCLELSDSKSVALFGQQIGDCRYLLSNPSVRRAYVALYSSSGDSRYAAELSSSLSDLQGTHELQQISGAMNSCDGNDHDKLTVIAIRRRA